MVPACLRSQHVPGPFARLGKNLSCLATTLETSPLTFGSLCGSQLHVEVELVRPNINNLSHQHPETLASFVFGSKDRSPSQPFFFNFETTVVFIVQSTSLVGSLKNKSAPIPAITSCLLNDLAFLNFTLAVTLS